MSIDLTKPLEIQLGIKWNPIERIECKGEFYLIYYYAPRSNTFRFFWWDPKRAPDLVRNAPEQVESFTVRYKNEMYETEIDHEGDCVLKTDRKVSEASRIDFEKPIELFFEGGKGSVFCEFVGQMEETSKNFPSWFICKTTWENNSCDDGDEPAYFLVRGDGKTDIQDWRVRNKKEKKSSRAVFTVDDEVVFEADFNDRILVQNQYLVTSKGTEASISYMTIQTRKTNV